MPLTHEDRSEHSVPGYAEQVQRSFRAFGRDQVHVIIYNDSTSDLRVYLGT